MMFTVIWKFSALQQLNGVLANADDPAIVQAAAARVDYLLRRLAPDLGESRSPGLRLWYGDVLGVFYHIDEGAKRVEVLFVGLSRRH